ncbi:MAG TPA: response regulator transcription factor [Bryobacteraceae bacterium]|nr:response regulator transcription factor [Bryobacteraceae bacterium]
MTPGRHAEGPTSETIFLIDDDLSVREGLTGLIESLGLPVQTFASAVEFLALKPPDAEGCVVLDVEMPGMDGLDLQRKMNESGISLPVIFLTGHGDIPMTVHAMKAGAVHFLTKPVREDELMNAIRQALESDREARSKRVEIRKLCECFDLLAPRERQVMRLVVSGRLNKEIAHELGVSERTIKLHRGHVMRKMRADSLADLVKQAEKLGPLRINVRTRGEISQASSSLRSG